MGVMDTYRSLRTPSNTWAREVATRVHRFYDQVIDYLSEEYEEWWIEEAVHENFVPISLHHYTLGELAKARAALNHPAMQLHEFVVTQDVAMYAEDFKKIYDRTPEMWKKASQSINKNIIDMAVYSYDHYIASIVARRHPQWLTYDDNQFEAAWDDALERAKKEAREYHIDWS